MGYFLLNNIISAYVTSFAILLETLQNVTVSVLGISEESADLRGHRDVAEKQKLSRNRGPV